MKRILVILIFIPFSIYSKQTFELKGTLTDQTKIVIDYGDVLLFKQDKVFKYTTVSNGKFMLNNIPTGSYVLKISSLGYAAYEKQFDIAEDLNLTISLDESATALEQVQLIATKKLIEYKKGNTLVNVENTIWSQASSTLDLISKLPSIVLSPDQSDISIVGKGSPLLYYGGQRITMEDFNGISIDDIKSIEIINNPSSKYEANGRAVILIRRRKSNASGVNLTLTEKAAQKTYFNNYLSTFLKLKSDRLEVKLDASYNQINVWEGNGATYNLPLQQTRSNYLVEATTDRTQYIVGGGIYYQINDSNYLSMSTRFRTQREPFNIDTETSITQDGVIQNILTLSDNIGTRQFMSSNFNYTSEFKDKGSLFFGGQYTTFNKRNENDIFNQFTNPISETSIKRKQDFDVENFTLRSDYNQPLSHKLSLDTGLNYASTRSISGVSITDTSITSSYKEQIAGVYSNFSYDRKKVSYRLGLRLENTAVIILNQPNSKHKSTSSYLFPKFNVDYKIDSTTSLNFNYAKSISRPNFTTVTTTSAFINPALEFRGAINLKPTLSDEISAAFQLKNYRLSARYYRSKDPVYYSISYDEQQKLSVMSPKNFAKENGVSLELGIPINYKFWTSNSLISLNYNMVRDNTALENNATPFVYFSSQHHFKINGNNSFHLNAWGQTKAKDGLFNTNGKFVLNAAFQTQLLKNLDLTLNYNNIFDNLTYKDNYTINQVSASSIFFTDVNEISLSLKYTLDSIKQSAYKNKDVDDQLNRVR